MAEETPEPVTEPTEPAAPETAPPENEPPSPPAPVQTQPAVPQTALGQVTARQPVEQVADLDDRFAEAKKSIEADEMLSEGDRKLKLLQLDVMYEERQGRIQKNLKSADDQIRDGYAEQYGAERKVVDSTWNEAVSESIRRRGRFDHGTAMTLFETKMDAARKQPEPAPIAEARPAGQTRTAPRGVRPAPPQPEKKMTVQEIMDRAAMGDTSAIPQDVLAEAKR